MTERRIEQVSLPDSRQLRLTIAEPDSPPRGAVVVVHEKRGVTPDVVRLAESLAGEGWLVLVPHLYHRDDSADDLSEAAPDVVRGQVAALAADCILLDADACCRWLTAHEITPDRIGVLGFGMGGAVALFVAARRTFGAAITVGGTGVVTPLSLGLPALVDVAEELCCPWLGLYCRGGEVPEAEVDRLGDAAYRAQVATDLVYFTEDRCRFDLDQPAAAEAWTRTLNWLDSHLR